MGMLFGGWANDPYEQDERELENRLGPEAYALLLKQREIDNKKAAIEYRKKWDRCKTIPKVELHDVVITDNGEELQVIDLSEDGYPIGSIVTMNGNKRGPEIIKINYKVLSTSIGEYYGK